MALSGAFRALDGIVAFEGAQREGDILAHALHHLHQFLVDRIAPVAAEHDDALAVAVVKDRNRRRRLDAVAFAGLEPRTHPLVMEIIVGDAGTAGAKRNARWTLAMKVL